jgi:hypothetical protein
MKKYLLVISIVYLLINTAGFAQSPEKISYQAVIRNAENKLIQNQKVGMQISILEKSVAGSPIYIETHTPTTNSNGLIIIEIGSGSVVSGDFSTIDWANGPYFIKTETAPEGGINYTISGVSQLLSVPYALYAKNAGNIPDIEGLASKQALEDTASALRSSISHTQQEIAYFPKSTYQGNNVLVSFSGNSTTNFSQASPVALKFEQATPIFPDRVRYLNTKNVDAIFYIPWSAASGTYDIIINPNSSEPNILEKAFIVDWF